MGIVDLGKALMPPGDPVTTWRWAVVGALITIGIVGSLHAADVLLEHDLTKYATADQMAAIAEQSSRFEQRYVKNQIRELSIQYCQALRDNDARLKSVYGEDLDDMLLDFKKLTGNAYPLRPCSET